MKNLVIWDWVFLARFCFLSHQGRFEYNIEFNEENGDPNLLLYYDTKDQWPSVYKTQKTCAEKEAVVHVDQNQVINLTARLPNYKTLAGCFYANERPTGMKGKGTKNSDKTYTITIPTLPSRKKMPTMASTSKEVQSTTIFDYSASTIEYDTEATSFTDWTSETTTDSTESENLGVENEIFETTTQTDVINRTRKVLVKRFVPEFRSSNQKMNRNVICHNGRSFTSSRERWWFVALSNCKSHKGIHVKYRILMTNGPPGDYWHEHLSADEFYILPILTAFTVSYTVLLLVIVVSAAELKARQLLHTTYKIFFLSVILQLFGIMLQTIAYLKYAMTGLDTMRLKRFGSIFMGASETCFLLLLLLLAKGYTVTRGRLPVSCSIKLTIFMCCYVVTYIAIFIYESLVFDPGEVLYLFESPAGYALIMLRLLAWCMFIYSTIFTLKHYPEKGNFYYPFNICGTLWFVAGPAFILSGNTYIDKWVRESVVCAMLLFIAFGGHLSFLILTMPSVANKNFPFHVRTTQIGVLELHPRNGTTTVENFVHHPYEPTIAEQTIIIPLTRRTEEIFEGMYNRPTYSSVKRTDESQEIQIERDNMMENVLNWSVAKNPPTLDYSQFVAHRRESIVSGNSMISTGTPAHNDRRDSQTNQSISGRYDDYMHDVPLELFTISKMSLSTHDSTNRQNSEMNNHHEQH
ncbi:transmembrane protein 145 [Coccinella septempunctata]|uniref:transmembrane protein 145 n=1 Tax=Coccinella septempunctata TaxID=41139 RepID=UPI001D07EE31|nr:transmembrane protein 145 [Coccinella septempunctata]